MQYANPVCAHTGIEVLRLFNETIAAFPPPSAATCGRGLHEPQPLGQYLLNLGYLNQVQLHRALHYQYGNAAEGAQLGVILVRHNLIDPQPLTVVLLRQMLDRLIIAAPNRLLIGDYLLVNKLIRVPDLQRALQSQIWLAARHQAYLPLGEVLMMHGAISQAAFEQALLARDNSVWQPLPMVG